MGDKQEETANGDSDVSTSHNCTLAKTWKERLGGMSYFQFFLSLKSLQDIKVQISGSKLGLLLVSSPELFIQSQMPVGHVKHYVKA